MYVDKEYYLNTYKGITIPNEDIEKNLNKASRHIDVLTFNRIRAIGFDNLTEFQQEIIRDCTCELADFEYDNVELIENVLSSYSINGVSMNFGDSWNVKLIKGVAMPSDLYSVLSQTGLTSRRL